MKKYENKNIGEIIVQIILIIFLPISPARIFDKNNIRIAKKQAKTAFV
jgi:hypothetical protein